MPFRGKCSEAAKNCWKAASRQVKGERSRQATSPNSYGLPSLLQVFLQSTSSLQLSLEEQWTSPSPAHTLRMSEIVI